MDTTQLDKALAHGLARLGLGVTICPARLRALTGSFRLRRRHATAVRGDVSSRISGLCNGYCIAIGEAVIGTLLVLGLWLRPALTAGSLLMILLLSGTCLLQNWSVAGLQLGYLAFYAMLLATASCDRSASPSTAYRGAEPLNNRACRTKTIWLVRSYRGFPCVGPLTIRIWSQ